MKRKVLLFIKMLGIAAFFYSCSSSDDEASRMGELQIYGAKYELETGLLWKNNPNKIITSVPYVWEDVYVNDDGEQVTDPVTGFTVGKDVVETGNFIVSFYERGLVLDETTESVLGKAACISLHMASPDTDELVEGKYVFGEEKNPNTFSGYCSSEYNTSASKNLPAKFKDGEVMVTKSGNEYRITFSGTTTFGGDVSGEFQGPMEVRKIQQVAFSEYNDVTLDGLLEVFYERREFMGSVTESYNIDDFDGKAFFSLASGIAEEAFFTNPDMVDISLFWDEENGSFNFESPLHMRKWLGHSDDYLFPCHTRYMKAPADFTNADFENLENLASSFEITEEEVKIGTTDFKPGFIMFETGRGVQGVIRYKSWTPGGIKREELLGGMIIMHSSINPALVIDVKCPAVVSNPQIR